MARKKLRKRIQLLSIIAYNPFLANFFEGKIYRGRIKTVCVPGLNCYSCPAAAGSCPIGALQSVGGASKYNFSYYVIGLLMLFGILLGRAVCGFLCPFGWFQELLHKLPTIKFGTRRLYFLTYLKTIVLLLFVIVLPITAVNDVGMGDPYFCKYLCPVGVLEGGLPLSAANASVRASLGWLFTWKTTLLLGIIVLSAFVYRPFCKWFCPLGAFYALFNKLAVTRLQITPSKCTACGRCKRACKMDVDVLNAPNHTECIRCGDCIAVCPNGALKRTFSLMSEEREV